MLTTKDQFERELANLIEKEIERLRENLENPGIETDVFRRVSGQIAGLRSARSFIREANDILDKRT